MHNSRHKANAVKNVRQNNRRNNIDPDVQEVIVSRNDSLNEENDKEFDGVKSKKKKFSKERKSTKSSDEGESAPEPPTVGNCSICWDKLGQNPLASTKCGHVFCLVCLERCLKNCKKCPSCRCILKGASAYHRLYLDLGLT